MLCLSLFFFFSCNLFFPLRLLLAVLPCFFTSVSLPHSSSTKADRKARALLNLNEWCDHRALLDRCYLSVFFLCDRSCCRKELLFRFVGKALLFSFSRTRMQRFTQALFVPVHPTRALLFWSQASLHGFDERTQKSRSAAVMPTLLLSPQTPPPIAKPAQTANFFIAAADAFVFSYGIFDFALILDAARQLSATDLLASPTSLLVPPHRLVCHPSTRYSCFAPARLAQFTVVLSALLDEFEASPRSLTYAVRQQRVSCPHFVPFLRGLCLMAAVAHPFTQQVGYVLQELQTSGFVSPQLFLHGTYAERQTKLANLLLAAAREFGCATVLHAGLQLIRDVHGRTSDYAVSRSVCLAVAKEGKRKLDWALKARGRSRYGFDKRQGWTHHST